MRRSRSLETVDGPAVGRGVVVQLAPHFAMSRCEIWLVGVENLRRMEG